MFMKNIMLSGPDGTGKSTILMELQKHYQNQGLHVKPVWLRFHHYFAKIVNILGRVTGKSYYTKYSWGKIGYHDYKGTLGIIYIYAVYLDHLIFRIFLKSRILRKEENTIIFIDRYILDIVADLIVDTGKNKIIINLFHPYIVSELRDAKTFILTCPKEIVTLRRGDIIDDKNYYRKIEAYDFLSRQYDISLLNTGILSIEDSINLISQKLDVVSTK